MSSSVISADLFFSLPSYLSQVYLCPDGETDGTEDTGSNESQIRPKHEADMVSRTTTTTATTSMSPLGKRGSPSSKSRPTPPTGVNVKREASREYVKEDSEGDLTAALLAAAAAQSSSSPHQVRICSTPSEKQMNK